MDDEKVSNLYISEIEKILSKSTSSRHSLEEEDDSNSGLHQKATEMEQQIKEAVDTASSTCIPMNPKDKQCNHEIFTNDSLINKLMEQRSVTP